MAKASGGQPFEKGRPPNKLQRECPCKGILFQLIDKVDKLSSKTEVFDDKKERRFRFGGYAARSAKTQGSRNPLL